MLTEWNSMQMGTNQCHHFTNYSNDPAMRENVGSDFERLGIRQR